MKVAVDVLNKEACKTARPLWEEVFFEDSVQFTDYYFENKANKNIGYIIGQAPYDAMMFRTPYMLQIGENLREISYIVGVATRKECRHRGYMRQLLMHSFGEMYREKMPFTFLMPANPSIYEPFDFKYIYEREVWELREPGKVIEILEALTSQEKENVLEWKGKQEEYELRVAELIEDDTKLHEINAELDGIYSVRSLCRQESQIPILHLLAEFANKYLEEHYNIYVHRDVSYYEMQLKELEAQNGDIYVFCENGEIKAFFLYAKEGEEIFLQEVMEEKEGTLDFLQKTEKKKPIIMARIIHLEEMMKMVCSKENTTMVIEIEDELIPENAGIYRLDMTPKGSKVFKIQSSTCDEEKETIDAKVAQRTTSVPEVSMHIRDFAPWVLTGVFLNEIV